MKLSFTASTYNLKTIERQAVTEAITYTQGNVQYARELLNVSKATIYRLLNEYNIDYLELRKRRYNGQR